MNDVHQLIALQGITLKYQHQLITIYLQYNIPLHNIHANDINCRFNAKDQNHVQYILKKPCESKIFKCQLFLTIIICSTTSTASTEYTFTTITV